MVRKSSEPTTGNPVMLPTKRTPLLRDGSDKIPVHHSPCEKFPDELRHFDGYDSATELRCQRSFNHWGDLRMLLEVSADQIMGISPRQNFHCVCKLPYRTRLIVNATQRYDCVRPQEPGKLRPSEVRCSIAFKQCTRVHAKCICVSLSNFQALVMRALCTQAFGT